MENNNKYLMLRLEERNGEYEYLHRSIHLLPDNKDETVDTIAKNYAKEFYCSVAEEEAGGYYFFGGEVFVKIDSWDFINEEEFKVLAKYL